MKIIQVHPSGWGFRERNAGVSFTPWGCNYYDPATGWSPRIWEQFDPVRVGEHLDHIQAIGANTIRVFSTIQNLLESPRRVRAAGIAKMMKMLALAEVRGLRVIWSGPSMWEGRPDWWREDAPYEVCARDDLMAALETAWRGMGKAFRGHPALFAYELQNEPYAPALPTPAMNQRWARWRATHAPDAPESLPKPPVREGERWLTAVHRFREDLATEYVRRMAAAVRETDNTHLVTIGMHQKSAPFDWYPPDSYIAFNPHRMAAYLDYTSIHFYPHHNWHPNLYRDPCETPDGMQETLWHARAICRYMHIPGKPLVMEECGWYSGGNVPIGGREQPWRSEAQQTDWCTRLVKATRGDVCGWLFWPYQDTPTASDFSRGSGLYTADGKLKDWGRAFARLAPRITAGRAVRTAATRTLALPWDALVTEPDAVKSFRAQYLDLFRRGKVVDFAIEKIEASGPVGANEAGYGNPAYFRSGVHNGK
ncbi:MAG: cellulase family glycosylhydrolase [Kiritimatiellia bacterium]